MSPLDAGFTLAREMPCTEAAVWKTDGGETGEFTTLERQLIEIHGQDRLQIPEKRAQP